MSQIMKTYLGVFLLLLLMFSTTGFLGAYMQIIGAQNMHAKIIDELENSGFYMEVIRENLQIADEKNYDLEFTLYRNGSTIVIDDVNDIDGRIQEIYLAKVRLSYDYEIPFYGISETQTLEAYAR